MSGYSYPTSINWGNWWSWNQAASFATDRSYDYVHVTAAYWALYRVARNYPALVKTQTWQWYINKAVQTVTTMTGGRVGLVNVGLMGETVFRLLLDDLKREGLTGNATLVESRMKSRASVWAGQRYPSVTCIFLLSILFDSDRLGSALRWHGTRPVKKVYTHGLNISMTQPQPRTL